MIKLLLTSSNNIGSLAIRTFSWSQWSHISTLISDTEAIEALPFKGVIKSSVESIIKDSNKHLFIYINIRNKDIFYNSLISQIGKQYDYSALLGFGLHRDWQDQDKWFCSELPAWSTIQCKEPIFRSDSLYRILPEDWYKISQERLSL
jgi:hypothetical protein